MNPLFLTSLALGLVVAGLYVGIAYFSDQSPSLPRAINVFISTVGAFGAIRLVGFVFTEQFVKLVEQSANHSSWLTMTKEDAVFLLAGGMALFWVSCQEVWKAFNLEVAVPKSESVNT